LVLVCFFFFFFLFLFFFLRDPLLRLNKYPWTIFPQCPLFLFPSSSLFAPLLTFLNCRVLLCLLMFFLSRYGTCPHPLFSLIPPFLSVSLVTVLLFFAGGTFVLFFFSLLGNATYPFLLLERFHSNSSYSA